MSRTDPFKDLSNAGVSGDPTRAPAQGTARVETRVTGGGSGTAGAGREADEMLGRAGDRAQETWEKTKDRTEGALNDAREQVDEWTDQAGEYASRARRELENVVDRAESRLEEKTGAVSMVRENPLLAAGVAFGVGFMLAGGSSSKRRSGLMGRASGQLRTAIVGSVSTMLMQELQDMMDEHGGPVGLLNMLTGRGDTEQPQR